MKKEFILIFFEDGVQQGIELGGIKTLVKLVSQGLLTTRRAAEQVQMTESEFVAAAGL